MKKSKLLVILLVIGLFIAFYALDLKEKLTLDYLKTHFSEIKLLIEESPTQSVIVYFLIYVILTAISFPGATLLTLAGGALFGFGRGLILVSFASTLGATLAFLGSRFLFHDVVKQKWGTIYEQVKKKTEQEGAYYLFALRLNPIFPFFVVNLVMGLTPIRLLSYFWVSQIGMLPGTAVYVNAGTRLGELDSLKGILSFPFLLSMAMLGLVPIVVKKLMESFENQKKLKNFSKPRRFDYNMIVIGGGSAGLVSSLIAAAVKAKVLLIEKHKMGGDCLNTGCVPSKAIIRSAKLIHQMKRADQFGLWSSSSKADFSRVMERVHNVIKKIEPHDSVERYTQLGVECLQGDASVISPWEVTVQGKTYSAKNIIIATGARPFVPQIPGLEKIRYVTSDNMWDLKELPRRLLVLGGGPIGCEMAQAFHRIGSEVTLIEKMDRLLARSEPEASFEILETFRKEGVRVLLSTQVERFDLFDAHLTTPNGRSVVNFDLVLVAIGRQANVNGFGLEKLGVKLTDRGTIDASPFLETSIPGIYVCGDVVGPFQLTHASSHQAWYAAVNSLFSPFKRYKADYRVMPAVTFTDPEVAQVGLTESEAKVQGMDIEVTQYGIDDLDRAIADGEAHGFVKVITPKGKDKILGVTIVSSHAGEFLAEMTLAMKYNLGLNKILATVHPYPTFGEANKYAAGMWRKAHAPVWALKFLKGFHQWRRS